MGILTGLGKRVYLDANVFVYGIEGYPPFVKEIREFFRAIDLEQIEGITGELTLAEVLVKPLADGRNDLCRLYEESLQNSRGLTVVPITRAVLLRAAQMRASSKVRLPDAIHLATAQLSGCDAFLTNDGRLKGLLPIKMVLLSEII